MLMITKRFFILIFIILTGLPFTSFAQSSTIYFYRLKNVVMASNIFIVAVNDTGKVTLSNGSYQVMKTDADSVHFMTSANNTGIKTLKLEKGKTYYIELQPGINSVNLIQQNEFTGKPAVERLEADQKSRDIKTSDLRPVKVTSVAPIPAASGNEALIYLFRPFNVTAVNLVIKVSDGSSVYEMKNNSSHVVSSAGQEITFTSINEGANTSNGSVKVKLEKGHVYYVAVLRTGGAIVLTETKEDYARKEMKLR